MPTRTRRTLLLVALLLLASAAAPLADPALAAPGFSAGEPAKPAAEEADTEEEAGDGDGEETGGEEGEGEDEADGGESTPATTELKPLEPGAFEPWFELEGEIFPSWILSSATMKSGEENEPDQLGDRDGSIGIRVCAPTDDCKIELTVSSAKILRPSKFSGVLPKKGAHYFVNPKLDFDYDTLSAIAQPFPENVKFQVSLGGAAPVERLETVTVRSVNDCPYGFLDEDGEWNRMAWTFAAYVNENHPKIHELMAGAKDEDGDPMVFAAYQRNADGVRAEIGAIWEVLKARGVRYSSITTPSLPDKTMFSQYVRRVGEAIAAEQANCVDGSVILASILRRIGLDVYLVSIPGHMYIAVKLERDKDDATTLEELTPIETTMIANGSLDEAIAAGEESFRKHGKGLSAALESEDDVFGDYAMVSVAGARAADVLPIREPEARPAPEAPRKDGAGDPKKGTGDGTDDE